MQITASSPILKENMNRQNIPTQKETKPNKEIIVKLQQPKSNQVSQEVKIAKNYSLKVSTTPKNTISRTHSKRDLSREESGSALLEKSIKNIK